MTGAAKDEVDEVRAPEIGIGHADLTRCRADPFQGFEADREDGVFLSVAGRTPVTAAVLSVR